MRAQFEKMIREAQDSICAAVEAADGGTDCIDRAALNLNYFLFYSSTGLLPFPEVLSGRLFAQALNSARTAGRVLAAGAAFPEC